jgi:hypothetical protein
LIPAFAGTARTVHVARNDVVARHGVARNGDEARGDDQARRRAARQDVAARSDPSSDDNVVARSFHSGPPLRSTRSSTRASTP